MGKVTFLETFRQRAADKTKTQTQTENSVFCLETLYAGFSRTNLFRKQYSDAERVWFIKSLEKARPQGDIVGYDDALQAVSEALEYVRTQSGSYNIVDAQALLDEIDSHAAQMDVDEVFNGYDYICHYPETVDRETLTQQENQIRALNNG